MYTSIQVAGFWDISFDIDVDPKSTVEDAHGIAGEAENNIKQHLENVCDIMIHIEQKGEEESKVFG